MVKKNQCVTVTLVRMQSSRVRNDIKCLRDKYNLSWRELAFLMGYKTKSSVVKVWAHPETCSQRFRNRLIMAEAKLREERNDVYQVMALVRLPRRFRVVGRARRCLGHGEWCLFGDSQQRFCNSECEILYQKKGGGGA